MAVAASCLLASQAHALGLGRLNVQSALGETLRAEIDWRTVIAGLREGDEEGTDPMLIALAENARTIPTHARVLRPRA